MKLLHIDSSILGPYSASRLLSAAVVARLAKVRSDVSVTYRDLAEAPIPHLSGALLTAGQAGELEHAPDLKADLAESSLVMQEFLAADTVVIGVAFYNFTVSTQLKAWIDRILIAGQTFRYGANGAPEGLAGDKRVILTIARGGLYGPDMPTRPFEHAETYLRTVLGFIGIFQPEVIIAEGLKIGPEQRQVAIAGAEKQIALLN